MADVKEGVPIFDSGTIGKSLTVGFTDDDHRYFSRLNRHQEQPGFGRLPAASTVTRETDLAENPHSTSEDRRNLVTSLTSPNIRGRLSSPGLKHEPNSPSTPLMTNQKPSFEKQPKLAPADRQPPQKTSATTGPFYRNARPFAQPASPWLEASSEVLTNRLRTNALIMSIHPESIFLAHPDAANTEIAASSDPNPSLWMSAASNSFSLPTKPDQVDMDDESPPFSTKEDDLDTEEL